MVRFTKYSEEEKRGYVREWESGGGSQKYFAERLGIADVTFYNWVRKYRVTPIKQNLLPKSSDKKLGNKQNDTSESHIIKEEVEFIPVNVVNPGMSNPGNNVKVRATDKGGLIEIRLGNSMTVAFEMGTDFKYVGNLIAELSSW